MKTNWQLQSLDLVGAISSCASRMAIELMPHQVANIDGLVRAMTNYGAALDASDTGTGKTFTALGLCKKLGAQPAIVTPLACIHAWEAACVAMDVKPVFIINYEGAKSKKFNFGEVIPSPRKGGKAKYQFKNMPQRVIMIFDEVQRCRNPRSGNTSMLLAAVKNHKTLMLSATPFTSPMEAFGIGLGLRLFVEHKWWNWQLRNGVRKNHWGRMEFKGDETHMLKIHNEIFPDRGVRTTRHEIPNFPETLIRCLAIEVDEKEALTAEYMAEIEASEKQDIINASEGVHPELLDLVEALPVTRNLRARQKAELLKVPTMCEMAVDAVAKGFSVPLFFNFDVSIELASSILKTKCMLRGHKPGGKDNLARGTAIVSFQQGVETIILVNSAAGGAGTNLHDPRGKRPRQAIISPPWSAVVLKQVLGRSNRSGGGYSDQLIIFAADTVEERVMKRLESRMSNLDTLTDGDLDVATLDI